MVGIWYSFTLLVSYMVSNPFKMQSRFLDSNDILPNLTGPWPRLQKGRIIPVSSSHTM